MANCQSGSIAHYLNTGGPFEVDNCPQAFRLKEWSKDGNILGSWLPQMVYGAFVDYNEAVWTSLEGPAAYAAAERKFVELWAEQGSALTVLLPTDRGETIKGEDFDFTELNNAWRSLEKDNDHVDTLSPADCVERNIIEPRHYSRETLIAVADALAQKLKH